MRHSTHVPAPREAIAGDPGRGYRVVLFANRLFPIDREALSEGLGLSVELILAPEECLQYPVDERAEAVLCSVLADAHAIVFRVGQVTRRMIQAGRDLRIVAVHGVGTEAVDVEGATGRGVYVTTAPGGNANAVAEYVMCVLLLASRRVHESAALLRSVGWNDARLPGGELCGKAIGIVGLGAIGSRVARLAEAFGMQVSVAEYPRLPSCEYPILPLADLAHHADFFVVAVPRRPETDGLVSEEIVRRMRRTSFFVNVSRGSVVDEGALLRALDDGAIAGACLDVFRQEPAPRGHPLVVHPRVLATPHVAGSTPEAQRRIARVLGTDVRRVFCGARPLHAVNDPRPA